MDTNNYRGRTAMHFSAQSNSPGIIRMLVEKGADINVQDKNGFTPIMYAIMHHANDAVKCFIEIGADLTIVSRYDGDCRSIAALAKNNEAENILNSHN